MDIGSEPVEDGELLYRRIPASTGWYDPAAGVLKAEAFGPHKTQDITGLSVARAKYKSIEEAARGTLGKSYFVAVLRASDLRKQGIDISPQPDLPDGRRDPAHAELPGLRADNRKATQTLEWQRLLAGELTVRVEGPFTT
ncbi:MAG: hypothetical protein ACYC35_27825 [Pirellulales bacterium]